MPSQYLYKNEATEVHFAIFKIFKLRVLNINWAKQIIIAILQINEDCIRICEGDLFSIITADNMYEMLVLFSYDSP